MDLAAREYLDKVAIHGGEILISTGLPSLDEALGGGYAAGELVIVAARPSNGKTLFGCQMAVEAARAGHKVAILSEEMTNEQLGKRYLQSLVDLPIREWPQNRDDIAAAINDDLGKCPRVVIPRHKLGTFDRAAQAIRTLKERHDTEVVVLDYLQLLRGRGANRYEQITEGCAMLHMLVVELGISLVLLAQLNRELDKRSGDPKFSDLRDTGQIEQDADCVLFLVWPYQADRKRKESDFQVFVAKNRNRGVRKGVIDLEIDAPRMTVRERSAWDDHAIREA